MNDEGELKATIQAVIDANPQAVEDYHNGIHGVLFYLLYCIPISFSGRQISSWEFCFLSVIYYLLFS